MIRTLGIVTVSAFVLAVVCLSIAVSMAGPDLIAEGFWRPWDRHNISWSHTVTYGGADTTREVAWTGGDTLVVQVPADVTFTQADGPAKLVVRGPKEALDRLKLDGSAIAPKDNGDRESWSHGGLTIELTAPKVTTFQVYDSGKLDIRNYRQDRIRIGTFGSREVTAEGSAKRLDLTINGSDSVDLSQLGTDEAAVTVDGTGEAKIAPKTWAKLEINGSGDVTLTTKPKQLHTRVTGSGHVEQADGSDAADAGGDPV
jgi:hypothetical protein